MVCWRNKVECQKPHKCPSQKASVCKCKELLTPLGHGAWQWEAASIYPALLEEKNSILNSVHLLLQRAFSFTVQQLASEHNCDLLEVKHPNRWLLFDRHVWKPSAHPLVQSLQHLTPWEQSTAFWALTPAWKQRTSTVISIPVNWHCLSTVNSYCLILLLWDEQRFRAQGEETSKPPLEGLRRSGSLQLLPRAARRLQDRIMRWDCSAGGKAQSSLCPENGICIYRPQLLEAEKHLQCCFLNPVTFLYIRSPCYKM